MQAVKAIYDGSGFKLREPVPVTGNYEVIITFIKRLPKKSKNPNNPSPSGDPWFDDPRNMAMVKKAIAQKGKNYSIDDPEIQAIFDWAKQ